jgi:acetyl coenzyme A synthetase (ADP forming)-like protein
MTTMTAYPAHLESDVVLRNGGTLHLRPIKPGDREKLHTMYAELSNDSMHMRFFDVRSPEEALRYSPPDVDYVRDFGVVGEIGGEIVAVAHYLSNPKRPELAEVAFTIADRLQNRGVATHLLNTLVVAARQNGIERFEAEVLSENQRMLDVFLYFGFEVKSRSEEGTIHISFPIASTEHAENLAAERSQKAAYVSMKAVFEPSSIAVVGASRRPGQLGNKLLSNLVQTGFTGALYVVNPNVAELEGVKAYPSLADIPGPVDLAIITVPAALVEGVVDDCVGKGVRAIVVITAGFGETGEAGRAMQRRLLDKVRAAGIRMVGPNCMGVLNTDPAVNMQGTFAPIYPPRGHVAMSSQSGALGLAILDYAKSLGIGLSTFISVGNKADVSGNDLIQYWAEDPQTDVMLLYLESFGNPRKFGEIARRVAHKKPIVAVKAGRSASGARAASSHTGALATSDAIVRDLFRQAGIIRTDTLEEMFDVAALLANQPLPLGRRVAIVTNAGGPGILAADACEANGLEIVPLTPETTAKLRAILPAEASVGNPIDMIASAPPATYARVVDLVLHDPNVDSVIVIYIPVLATDAPDTAAAIRGAGATSDKTVIATFMSSIGMTADLAPIPSFPFPERAVAALARATAYAEWRRRPTGTWPAFDDIDREQLRTIVDRRIAAGGGWLEPLDVVAMLLAARIPVALAERVMSVYEAVNCAMRIGFPVALKAHGPELLHKTEKGAVVLNLQDEREVREAYVDLQERLGDSMTEAVVQQMVRGGVEVMLGVTEQPTFGHVIAYGAGGTLVELLSDVALRIHPLTDVDAADMIADVRWSKLLEGFRGAPPSDIATLREIILRLSELVSICPEIRELDINPLTVLEQSAMVVDARVRVERVVPGPPSRRIAY